MFSYLRLPTPTLINFKLSTPTVYQCTITLEVSDTCHHHFRFVRYLRHRSLKSLNINYDVAPHLVPLTCDCLFAVTGVVSTTA